MPRILELHETEQELRDQKMKDRVDETDVPVGTCTTVVESPALGILSDSLLPMQQVHVEDFLALGEPLEACVLVEEAEDHVQVMDWEAWEPPVVWHREYGRALVIDGLYRYITDGGTQPFRDVAALRFMSQPVKTHWQAGLRLLWNLRIDFAWRGDIDPGGFRDVLV